ncbi:MAG TPA: pitrilysin family protein [Gemmatimonadaceae bacterium]|nr:pitrilysin family protein [Gemmatimonadaceae bacterium]
MRKLILVVSIAAFGAAATLEGQDIDRSKRPDIPPAAAFHFPAVHHHKLPNGLQLYVVEDHTIPLVAARIILPDASLDPVGKEGLDSLTIGVLREGTTTKGATELAEASADLGTTVTPTRFTVTSDEARAALSLVGDMLMHSLLDSGAVERRRAGQAAQARGNMLNPSTPARRLFYSLIYSPDDDFVRSLAANDTVVGRLTRDDVLRHYQQYIGPRTTAIVLVGDLTDAAALSLVKSIFGSWSSPATLPARRAAASVAPHPTTIYISDVPAFSDAYVFVGNAIAPRRSTPDFYAAEVASIVAHLRMQLVLREQRSLMYSGSSGIIWSVPPRPSVFVGSTRLNVAKSDTALVAWLGFLRELRSGTASAQDVDAARKYIVAFLTQRMDGPDQIADRVADMVRGEMPLDYYDRYMAGIAAVTPAEANAAAAKIFDTDHFTISISGPRAALERVLRAANIAPVVAVDANGRPIESKK